MAARGPVTVSAFGTWYQTAGGTVVQGQGVRATWMVWPLQDRYGVLLDDLGGHREILLAIAREHVREHPRGEVRWQRAWGRRA